LARVLLLLIIAFLIYLIFRGFFRAQTRKSEAAAKAAAASEDMVACARCGVNVPRSEAAMKDGVFYCKDNPRCRAP
jgi:uncharacterized protein